MTGNLVNGVHFAAVSQVALGAMGFLFNGRFVFRGLVDEFKGVIAQDALTLSSNELLMTLGFNVFEVVNLAVHRISLVAEVFYARTDDNPSASGEVTLSRDFGRLPGREDQEWGSV